MGRGKSWPPHETRVFTKPHRAWAEGGKCIAKGDGRRCGPLWTDRATGAVAGSEGDHLSWQTDGGECLV